MNLRKTRVLGALTIAVMLLLAACGQQTPPVANEGSARLTLSVAADALSSQSLTTQGSPFVPATGATAIEEVHVTVLNGAGQVVSFEMEGDTYVASEDGDVDVVTLAKSLPDGDLESADVTLPFLGNPYTFETRGYSDLDDPVIAYASQRLTVSDDAIVSLQPVSVLGGAQLAPRLPLNFALPGTVVDLMLVVTANGHDGLRVPIGDFEAQYDMTGDANVVATSNRGIRLEIGEQCTTAFTVTGSVDGLIQDGSSFVDGSVGMNDGDGYEVVCPPLSEGGITYDSEPPTVSVTRYDPSTGVVEGTARDNMGIAKVQLYDGPVLVASTETNELSGSVSLIEFDADLTDFSTTLSGDPVAGLVAIALDSSGNQSSHGSYLGEQFAHCPAETDLYVSSVSGYDGEASAVNGTPFATIQAAINAAADGDIVCVAPGTYAVDNSGRGSGKATVAIARIAKPLMLIGPNAGTPAHEARGPEARIVSSSTEDDWILGFSISSSDVTVDGFYVTTDTPKPAMIEHYGVWGFYVSRDAVENVVVANNHVVDAFRPIWINRGRAVDPATGFVVEGNLVEGPRQVSDQAIVFQGASGEVLNNVMRDTRVGLQVQPYNRGDEGVVAGNSIEAFQNGLWYNYQKNENTSWLFDSNEVLGVASPLGWPLFGEDPPFWSGIRIETFQEGEVTFTNNAVRAGAADPGEGNAYLVRQRGHRDGVVLNIGTETEPGSFFTDNSFPEYANGVTPADITVDNGLLQLVAPSQ